MIFNLFKSKPTLRELIPNGYVDIHSHILPGIDDGAKNLQESIFLIKKMKELGFSKIIGTPHTYPGLYSNTTETIKKSFEKLKNKKPDGIDIYYATEYLLDNSLLKKVKNKELLCIGGNYVLVEMSYLAAPVNLYEIIFELVHNDYIPVVAHPERYIFLHNNFKEYYKLKNFGCKFQINLLSSVGYYGKSVAVTLDKLLEKKMVDFVGSDIHNNKHIEAIDNSLVIENIDELKKVILGNAVFS